MTYLIGSLVRARIAAEQRLADARAAAGIDDGDGIVADDEAGVGDVAGVARREQLVAALVHEDAGRDLVNGEGLGARGDNAAAACKARCNSGTRSGRYTRA